MAKLMDVSDNDVAVMEDTIAERLALGVSQAVAQRQAVDEALAQLAEERSAVMKAVQEQLGAGSQDEPYSKAPDNLMGYRKNGPQKSFDESNYKHVEFVRVTWPDGESMVDAVKGLNRSHTLERARRNWKTAEIERITRAEAEAEDPEIGKDVDAAMGVKRVDDPELNEIAFSNKSAIGFYSALSDAVANINAKAQPVDGWKAQIKGLIAKGAIKADEVEWTGLTDWLDLQEGRVTKDAVAAYLDANGVQVTETTLGKSPSLGELPQGWRVQPTDDSDGFGTPGFEIVDDAGDVQGSGETEREARMNAADGDELMGLAPKYGQYTLPGGENYREVLLTLPDKAAAARIQRFGEIDDEIHTASPERFKELYAERDALAKQTSQSYQSSHWDQKNVLAHIRVNDRVDADGSRVLFVEEVQSDWGQDGKKKGGFFKETDTAATTNRMRDITARLREIAKSGVDEDVELQAEWNKLSDEKSRLTDSLVRRTDLPPLAPFVTKTDGWLNLALKRIISMAVDGGYDKVAFVNGAQSADRYDLSKSVQQVMAKKEGDEFIIFVRDSAGKNHNMGIRSANELPDVVGKELAEKIVAQKKDMDIYEGLDLKVGGEGMKSFYDSIVPNAVKALLKKVGGGSLQTVGFGGAEVTQVGRSFQVTVDGETKKFSSYSNAVEYANQFGAASMQQPGFDITDAMREKAAVGMPLFSNKAVDDPQTGISTVLLELGKKDWLYQSPVSTAKDVAGIAKDKGVTKVREDDIGGGVKEWKITLPDTVDTDTGKTVRGRSAYLRQKGNELWIDAEITGEGFGGSKLYDIGFNYAHNNPGVVFIGDRHGFSKVAMIRRLENMISAAIKYGSTDFMAPHAKQVMGSDGVPGFRWEKGDTLGNLRRMIDASQAAMQNKQPALAAVQYDQPTNQFVDSEGNPLGYDDLHDLAGAFRPSERSGGAGVTTIQRAALYRALLQSSGARRAFLETVRGLSGERGKGNGGALEGIAYANKAQTESPEFKRWFGDSKVVDADGKPRVVYHYTENDFNIFDTTRRAIGGEGSYFSTYKPSVDGGRVVEAYLSLKNPKVITHRQSDDVLKQQFIEQGHDGVIILNANGSIKTAVAFYPTQIKSAIGNSGQFDGSNPDIRFANKAQTGSKWDAPEGTRSDALIQKLQDGRIDLKRVQEAISAAGAAIPENFDARQAETLYAGRVATRSKGFLNTEAKPLLEAMARNNVTMAELSDYLLARHAPERNAHIAAINPSLPDGGAGSNSAGVLMTTAAANAHIAAISSARQTLLKMLASKVDKITADTADLLVSEGLETAGTVASWRAAYKNYVPLHKDEATSDAFNSHPTGSGFNVNGRASKASMGSTKQVTNMLAHVLIQREVAITRAEKNRVGLALYGLALTEPNPDFWTTVRPGMDSMAIANSLQSMGVPASAMLDMDNAPTIQVKNKTTGMVETRTNPLYKQLPNALIVKVQGEDRVVLFNTDEPRAARLIANLKNLDGAGMELAQATIGRVTRFMASLLTQYNPVFAVKNGIRDTLGGLVNLQSTALRGKQMQVLGALAPAAAGIAGELAGSGSGQWSALFREFQEEGGMTGFMDSSRDPFKRAKELESMMAHAGEKYTPRALTMAVLHALGGFNDTIENTVRLAAYKVALDSGMSKAKAAVLARELTVDFNRKGSWTSALSPFYAFFNAAVQGNARNIGALMAKGGGYIVAGGVTLGVLQALLLAAAGYDDDEINEFVKTRSFIIPTGKKEDGTKRYVQIPLPAGLHVLPNTGRVMTELVRSGGKDWKTKTWTALGEVAGALNPFGGGNPFSAVGLAHMVAPTAMDPMIDLGTGQDFAGRPISKQVNANDPRPGYLLGRENAQRLPSGAIYKEAAKVINAATGGRDFSKGALSPTPEEVKYAVMAVGGGLLRELEKGTNSAILASRGQDVPPYQVPLFGALYGEVDDAQVQRTRYYANVDKIKGLDAEMKALRSAKRPDEARALQAEDPRSHLAGVASDVGQQLSMLNHLAAGKMDDPVALKRLDEKRTAAMKRLNDRVIKAEKAAEAKN
jgi:hypothetical protein